MNSLTRPLPYHFHWRCLSTPLTNGISTSVCSGSKMTLPLNATGTGMSLLGQRSSLGSSETGNRMRRHSLPFTPTLHLHTGQSWLSEQKVKTALEDCYAVLGVDGDCDDQTLKEAYLEKAKAYHPDSASSTSPDPYAFSQVNSAYKSLLEHRKGAELQGKEEEEDAGIIFDIKHTAPQHRQYLEFEGVGFGTPSQRQRQYRQHRVARVTENIFQHRIQKHAADTEDALVVKDKRAAKKAVISNAMERIVEDMIQESMKRGDFNNLAGAGKPLEYSAHNPFVDVTTHNLNKIMVNNGFAPEWIMLQSEIRKEIGQARQKLAVAHKRLKEKPRSPRDTKLWKESVLKFRQQFDEINYKINKFNLIVPFLNKQLVPYNMEREQKKVMDNVEQYLPQDTDGDAHLAWDVSLRDGSMALSRRDMKTDWSQVWQDIKKVFQTQNKVKS